MQKEETGLENRVSELVHYPLFYKKSISVDLASPGPRSPTPRTSEQSTPEILRGLCDVCNFVTPAPKAKLVKKKIRRKMTTSNHTSSSGSNTSSSGSDDVGKLVYVVPKNRRHELGSHVGRMVDEMMIDLNVDDGDEILLKSVDDVRCVVERERMLAGDRCPVTVVEAVLGRLGLPEAAPVLDYLVVPPVDAVQCVGASSRLSEDMSFDDVVQDSDGYWLSASDRKLGGEWLEFHFSGLRRVRRVLIRIPPRHSGSLAVKRFQLAYLDDDNPEWLRYRRQNDGEATLFYTVDVDTPAMQHFYLDPPIEARALRVVCLSNNAEEISRRPHRFMESYVHGLAMPIGLYQVGFL